nr:hypothetical protein [uncultured Mediterranean phage uvMED]
MKIQSAKAGIGTGRAGLQAASGLFSNAGLFDKGVKSFNPLDLDPYLLFDAQTSMIGTLENPTLDLDPSKQDTLDVITATRAGTATFTDANGNIATAPSDTVRVDYVDGVPMILCEPSATNLLPYSEDFSNAAWVKADTSITSNAGTSPDGGNNASLLTVNSSSVSYLREFLSISATAHTFSIYAKAGTATDIQLYVVEQGVTSGTADVNIQSGVVTNATSNWNGGVTTEDVGNGWFRIRGTRTFTTSASNHGIGVAATGQNGLNFYLWGAQLESGSVATSLIRTSGSTATRAKDDLVISGSAFSDFFNASEGTTYIETAPKTTTNLPHIFEYHNSSDANANRMGIYLPSATSNAYVRSSGVTTASLSPGTINLNQLNRVAISYKVNDILGSVNGSSEVSDTSAALPSGLDKLHIGNVYSLNLPLNGHIKRLIYWPYHSDHL